MYYLIINAFMPAHFFNKINTLTKKTKCFFFFLTSPMLISVCLLCLPIYQLHVYYVICVRRCICQMHMFIFYASAAAYVCVRTHLVMRASVCSLEIFQSCHVCVSYACSSGWLLYLSQPRLCVRACAYVGACLVWSCVYCIYVSAYHGVPYPEILEIFQSCLCVFGTLSATYIIFTHLSARAYAVYVCV